MDKLLTLMNFSHVYENEKFYLSEEYNWVDCTNINGTNGYCDESALAILKEKVQAIKAEGIHFIDSYNFSVFDYDNKKIELFENKKFDIINKRFHL